MNQEDAYVELSHIIESGMITYRGLPAPIISDHLTREGPCQAHSQMSRRGTLASPFGGPYRVR